MSRVDFGKIMAFITAAIGKPLSDEALVVYYELLGDLPVDVLQTAAKRVCLEHKWANFPTVAELREAAAETMRGAVKELSAAEVWDRAWSLVRSIDLEVPHTVEVLKNQPPIVQESIKAFGLPALVYGKEPVGVIRGQFIKIVEQLQARDRRNALLPASVKQSIAAIGNRPEVGRIGLMPTETEQ